jgi:hypothetical protein
VRDRSKSGMFDRACINAMKNKDGGAMMIVD